MLLADAVKVVDELLTTEALAAQGRNNKVAKLDRAQRSAIEMVLGVALDKVEARLDAESNDQG